MAAAIRSIWQTQPVGAKFNLRFFGFTVAQRFSIRTSKLCCGFFDVSFTNFCQFSDRSKGNVAIAMVNCDRFRTD